MTKIMDINATTTDQQIESAISYLDMRAHAIEQRDMAAAVLEEQGDQVVLELHEIGSVHVLYSPVYGYAMLNEQSPGVGDSLTVEDTTPDQAAERWRLGN